MSLIYRFKSPLYFLLGLFLMHSVAVLIAMQGLRGSDQYWYIAKVEALCSGKAISHEIWPYFLFNQPGYLEAPQFLHNSIVPNAISWISCDIDPYRLWVLINLLMSLLTVAMIYAIISRISQSQWLSLTASAVYLLNPLHFWLVSQPLVGVAQSFLITLTLFVITFVRPWALGFLAVTLVLLVADHVRSVIVIPYAFLFAGYFLLQVRQENRLPGLITIIGSAGLFLLVKIVLSEDTLGMSLSQIAMNGAMSGSNMEAWLSQTDLIFDVRLFVQKVINQLLGYLSPVTFVFNFVFMATLAVVLILTGLTGDFRHLMRDGCRLLIFLACLGSFLSYASIVLIHQNQARYSLSVMPALVVSAAIFWPYFRFQQVLLKKVAAVLIVLMCAGSLGLTIFLIHNLRKSAVENQAYRSEVEIVAAQTRVLSEADRVMLCYDTIRSPLLVSYALQPKQVAFVPSWGDLKMFDAMAARSQASVLLCDKNTLFSIYGNQEHLIDVSINGQVLAIKQVN